MIIRKVEKKKKKQRSRVKQILKLQRVIENFGFQRFFEKTKRIYIFKRERQIIPEFRDIVFQAKTGDSEISEWLSNVGAIA